MNIVFASATQLAKMIRDQEVSAVEVLNAYLNQIEKYNHKINAIATLNREPALKRAAEADEALARGENWGALHGVPITLKDTFETSGEDLRLCLTLTVGVDPRQPDVPPVPLDTADKKNLSDLKIAWSNSWEKMTSTSEIKQAINLAVNQFKPVCREVEQWTSPPFDLPEAFRVCNQLTAMNFVYSQPVGFDESKKNLPVMFREATQGDKELRDLSNLSHFLPALLNPTLKKYFAILTQRDRLIAQMDEALKPWDVWLCPVAMTTAFTHRPKGAVIELEGRKVPYFLANGGYTMLFNLTGHPVVVIPITPSKTRLPIGMQIVGKRWREIELLAIADKIDRVVGNFQHPPL